MLSSCDLKPTDTVRKSINAFSLLLLLLFGSFDALFLCVIMWKWWWFLQAEGVLGYASPSSVFNVLAVFCLARRLWEDWSYLTWLNRFVTLNVKGSCFLGVKLAKCMCSMICCSCVVLWVAIFQYGLQERIFSSLLGLLSLFSFENNQNLQRCAVARSVCCIQLMRASFLKPFKSPRVCSCNSDRTSCLRQAEIIIQIIQSP